MGPGDCDLGWICGGAGDWNRADTCAARRVFAYCALSRWFPWYWRWRRCLRLGAPSLDATLSARPLAQEIDRVDNRSLPLAILRLSRETEYGLHFYRNQKIVRYEADDVPAGEHLLITPEGGKKTSRSGRPAGESPTWEALRSKAWIITGWRERQQLASSGFWLLALFSD